MTKTAKTAAPTSPFKIWVALALALGTASCRSPETPQGFPEASIPLDAGGSEVRPPDRSQQPETRADAAPTKLRVLFVGNSYTSVNDLPGTFASLAASVPKPPDLQVSSRTKGGAMFATHYVYETATVADIGSGKWTHIVLQGQSLEPVEQYAIFEKYGLLLAQTASSAGSAPVFYETWAREAGNSIYGSPVFGGSPQAMQDLLHAAYESLAKKAGGRVAHVGDAWEEALNTDSTLDLYAPDGSHPTELGTYLAACVFFGVLTGRSPLEITKKPSTATDAAAQVLRAAAAKLTKQ